MARILRKAGDLPRKSLWQRVKDVALMDVGVLLRGGVTPGSLERLEELLLAADFGVPVTLRLVEEVVGKASRGEVHTHDDFLSVLRAGVERALQAGSSEPALCLPEDGPAIILVLGVNGAGKTTAIGKLAARFREEGRSVLLAAADTFRAGAIDQLRIWAER